MQMSHLPDFSSYEGAVKVLHRLLLWNYDNILWRFFLGFDQNCFTTGVAVFSVYAFKL